MQEYQFGKLKINPVLNPAVLKTITWDEEKIKQKFNSSKSIQRSDKETIFANDIKIYESSKSV